MKLKLLVGSGDKIMLLTLPFLVGGVILNVMFPSVFSVGGPPTALRAVSVVALIVGLTVWIWSVALILDRVPKRELITTGPYRIVKHPLYTGVALLVIPSIGFLLDTWLGVVIGAAMYIASRRYSPEEEKHLAETFGADWDAYCREVMVPWL